MLLGVFLVLYYVYIFVQIQNSCLANMVFAMDPSKHFKQDIVKSPLSIKGH